MSPPARDLHKQHGVDRVVTQHTVSEVAALQHVVFLQLGLRWAKLEECFRTDGETQGCISK
jgi:hypothetical protein